MSRGKIEPDASPSSRALPNPPQIYVGELQNPTELAPVDMAPEAVQKFRYLDRSVEECLESRHCFTEQEKNIDGERACTSACMPPNPSTPADPQLPVMHQGSACPSPWELKTTEAGIQICAPAINNCQPPEIALPKDICLRFDVEQRGCRTVDNDRWNAIARDGAFFVDPTATAGGSGTRDFPFLTIDQALAAPAPPGGRVIALAAGVHDGPTNAIVSDVSFIGACPAGTTIRNLASRDALIDVATGTVSVQDLTVRSDSIAFRGGDQSRLNLAYVDIQEPGSNGISSTGEVDTLKVRIARPRATAIHLSRTEGSRNGAHQIRETVIEQPAGDGIRIDGNEEGELTVQNSRFDGGPSSVNAISVAGPHGVNLDDVSIQGFFVALAAAVVQKTVRIDRLEIAETSSTALIFGPGAHPIITGAVIERTGGIAIRNQGGLDLNYVSIIDSGGSAISMGDGALDATDTTLIRPGGTYAITTTSRPATVDKLEWTLIHAPANGALRISRPTTINHLTVTAPGPSAAPVLFCGGQNMTLDGTHVRLENAPGVGIRTAASCFLDLDEVSVIGAAGIGLEVLEDSRATLDRAVIQSSGDYGVSTFDGSTVLLRNVESNAFSFEGRSADVSSFAFDSTDRPAARLRGMTAPVLKDGRINANAVAVEVDASRAKEITTILDHVVIDSGELELR